MKELKILPIKNTQEEVISLCQFSARVLHVIHVILKEKQLNREKNIFSGKDFFENLKICISFASKSSLSETFTYLINIHFC